MTAILLRKYLREGRWLLLATGAAIFAFCWLRIWMVSRIDAERFKGIIDMLPTEWQKFSPVEIQFLITYTGRIAAAFSEPIVLFGTCAWAIARGSDVVSGELSRGTLEMLLAQPVSRVRIIVCHALVTTAGSVLLASLAWLGNWSGIESNNLREEYRPAMPLPLPGLLAGVEVPNPFAARQVRLVPMSQRVRSTDFLPGAVNLFCFGFFLAGFTTMISACDRHRWRTIGAACFLIVASMISKLVGMAGIGLDWMRYVSLFSVYEPEHLIMIGHRYPGQAWRFIWSDESGNLLGMGPLGFDAILLLSGLLAYVGSAVIFHRRDLPAPT
jgi:ABC-2 type transport system permease protein